MTKHGRPRRRRIWFATNTAANATQRDSAFTLGERCQRRRSWRGGRGGKRILGALLRRRLGRLSGYCGDEDDAVFADCQDDTHNGEKRHRIAAVVDSGAAENVLPLDVCSHIKPTPTDKSRVGIGLGRQDKIQNFGKRELWVKVSEGARTRPGFCQAGLNSRRKGVILTLGEEGDP